MVEQTRLLVSDMTCGGCAARVRSALTGVSGVSDIDIDVESKEVTAHYDPEKTTPEALRESIDGAGFTATFI